MTTDDLYTIDQLLRAGATELRETSATARLDAEVLLGYLLSYNRLQLIMNVEAPVPPALAKEFFQLIGRRAQSEPVAYLVGEKEFYGLALEVSADVLIPRPETEILVDAAMRHLRTREGEVSILDLGTGSGAIPIAIAVTMRQEAHACTIMAIDQSAEALEVAQRNAQRHYVQEQIQFLKSNWFSAVPDARHFDLIVSNPPYIAKEDTEISTELKYEPQAALYAADDGLSDIARILSGLAKRKFLPSLVLLEIGARQGAALRRKIGAGDFGAVFQSADVEILPDLAGLPRVLAVRFLN